MTKIYRIVWALTVIVTGIILYLVCAFFEFGFNPAEWHKYTRLIYGLAMATWFYLTFIRSQELSEKDLEKQAKFLSLIQNQVSKYEERQEYLKAEIDRIKKDQSINTRDPLPTTIREAYINYRSQNQQNEYFLKYLDELMKEFQVA